MTHRITLFLCAALTPITLDQTGLKLELSDFEVMRNYSDIICMQNDYFCRIFEVLAQIWRAVSHRPQCRTATCLWKWWQRNSNGNTYVLRVQKHLVLPCCWTTKLLVSPSIWKWSSDIIYRQSMWRNSYFSQYIITELQAWIHSWGCITPPHHCFLKILLFRKCFFFYERQLHYFVIGNWWCYLMMLLLILIIKITNTEMQPIQLNCDVQNSNNTKT